MNIYIYIYTYVFVYIYACICVHYWFRIPARQKFLASVHYRTRPCLLGRWFQELPPCPPTVSDRTLACTNKHQTVYAIRLFLTRICVTSPSSNTPALFLSRRPSTAQAFCTGIRGRCVHQQAHVHLHKYIHIGTHMSFFAASLGHLKYVWNYFVIINGAALLAYICIQTPDSQVQEHVCDWQSKIQSGGCVELCIYSYMSCLTSDIILPAIPTHIHTMQYVHTYTYKPTHLHTYMHTHIHVCAGQESGLHEAPKPQP